MENKTTNGTAKVSRKSKAVRCAYCGRVVRALHQRSEGENALCAKCAADPSITGLDAE